jgi:hypothetical protein
MSNKSCGISIGIRNKTIKAKCIHEVMTPPKPLQGRMGGLRIVNNYYDIAPIGIYFPPKTYGSLDRKHYMCTVDALCKELDKWLCKLPARCIPIIGTDLNDQLYRWPASPQSGGMNIDAIEMYAANAFHTVLAKHRLTAVNTIIGLAEHTYFGARSTSMIDYTCMPADCTERIKACKLLHKIAHQLAPFEKVNKFMDHKPILTLCDLALRHDRIKQ